MKRKENRKAVQHIEERTGRSMASWCRLLEKMQEQAGLMGQHEMVYYLEQEKKVDYMDAIRIVEAFYQVKK